MSIKGREYHTDYTSTPYTCAIFLKKSKSKFTSEFLTAKICKNVSLLIVTASSIRKTKTRESGLLKAIEVSEWLRGLQNLYLWRTGD